MRGQRKSAQAGIAVGIDASVSDTAYTLIVANVWRGCDPTLSVRPTTILTLEIFANIHSNAIVGLEIN